MRKVYKFVVPLLATLIVLGAVQSLNAQTKPTTFFVAIYERGPAWDDKKSVMEQPNIRVHRDHILSLGDKLVGAAPFSNVPNSDMHIGMIIFRANDIKEAEKWLESDPLVISKVAKAVVLEWSPSGWRGPTP